MRVEQLRLINFQKHRKLTLDLSPGLNVILGATNRGKSSIMRAWGRLCSNRPAGTSCIRFGKKQAIVEAVIVGSGGKRTVRYSKSSSSGTAYSLDQSHFKRCGRIVPEEVKEALNLDPEINLQPQHRLFFVLDASSSQEAAKQLARGTNIEITGACITESRRIYHDLAGRRKAIKAELQSLRSRLSSFDPLTDADRVAVRLSAAFSTYRTALYRSREIDRLVRSVRSADRQLLIFENLPSSATLSDLVEKECRQKTVLKALSEIKHDIGRDSADTFLAEKIAARVRVRLERAETLEQELEELRKLMAEVKRADETIKELEAEASRVKAKLGNVCLACGRRL
jgi:DNA repair ATPase RecN